MDHITIPSKKGKGDLKRVEEVRGGGFQHRGERLLLSVVDGERAA